MKLKTQSEISQETIALFFLCKEHMIRVILQNLAKQTFNVPSTISGTLISLRDVPPDLTFL